VNATTYRAIVAPGMLLIPWLITFAEAAVAGIAAAWIGIFRRRRKQRALA
jgi:hypothetical protein